MDFASLAPSRPLGSLCALGNARAADHGRRYDEIDRRTQLHRTRRSGGRRRPSRSAAGAASAAWPMITFEGVNGEQYQPAPELYTNKGLPRPRLPRSRRAAAARESRPGKAFVCVKLRGWLILLAIYALERNHRPGRAGGPGGASRWAPTAAGAASPVKLRAAVDLVVPPSVVGGARISQGAKRP